VSLCRRKRTDDVGGSGHQVEVVTFDDADDAAFVAFCRCGTVSPPFPTPDEARRWGRNHGAEVDEDVRVLSDDGGVGWDCLFCGSVIEDAPLRLSVSWSDDGVDGEQWYAAHRTCLVERMSADAAFAPRFHVPGSEKS
jgi:hypothetical protein